MKVKKGQKVQFSVLPYGKKVGNTSKTIKVTGTVQRVYSTTLGGTKRGVVASVEVKSPAYKKVYPGRTHTSVSTKRLTVLS